VIEPADVYASVKRGYSDLSGLRDDEISAYFSDIDGSTVTGHLNNIKGILFEQQYVESLSAQGIHAEVFEATNHPIVDVAVFSQDEIVSELQLKATESVSYINATLAENPDVPIVVTSEVALSIDSDMVIDSGIAENTLEEAVAETLFDEVGNPVNPLSIISWLVGLPF
jgi:hypothetical protein